MEVAHKILGTVQSPNSFSFSIWLWAWTWDLDSGLSIFLASTGAQGVAMHCNVWCLSLSYVHYKVYVYLKLSHSSQFKECSKSIQRAFKENQRKSYQQSLKLDRGLIRSSPKFGLSTDRVMRILWVTSDVMTLCHTLTRQTHLREQSGAFHGHRL